MTQFEDPWYDHTRQITESARALLNSLPASPRTEMLRVQEVCAAFSRIADCLPYLVDALSRLSEQLSAAVENGAVEVKNGAVDPRGRDPWQIVGDADGSVRQAQSLLAAAEVALTEAGRKTERMAGFD